MSRLIVGVFDLNLIAADVARRRLCLWKDGEPGDLLGSRMPTLDLADADCQNTVNRCSGIRSNDIYFRACKARGL